mgnify:CR=1 FL=1
MSVCPLGVSAFERRCGAGDFFNAVRKKLSLTFSVCGIVAAKVALEGTVSDLKLLASDHILSNLIWKKLEICHAMKLEGRKVQEGFHVSSVRVIEAAMLPMVLQGYAGDCLLKKALEIAPFVD